MIELMLDIETLSTRVDAHILQVALVPFDLEQAVMGTNVFNVNVSAGGQNERHRDVNTFAWWLEQSPEVTSAVFNPRKAWPLGTMLSELFRYVQSFPEETRVWCKGPEFDTAILKHAYEQVGMSTPWNHRRVRDVRTAQEISRATLPRTLRYGPTHDAVDDCREQIKDLYWNLYEMDDLAEEQLA